MKFLVDMDVSDAAARFLRGLGFDATHLRESGLQRLQDPKVLAKARDEGRILVTHDLDFPSLMAASGSSMPSVVVFRLKDMRPQNVNRHLEELVSQHAEELKEGVIVSVTEARFRIRHLPLNNDT